jgi:regulatory protein
MNDEYKKYYLWASTKCAKRETCTPEIKKKLLNKGADSELCNAIIKQLKDEKFIDDVRYCNLYIDEKIRIHRWGKIKVSSYLRQKNIGKAIFEEILSNISEDLYVENINYHIAKKLKTLPDKTSFKTKVKIIRYLIAKGYENQLIIEEVDKIFNEQQTGKQSNKENY